MAKGLSLPVGVDSSGGTKWVEGEANDQKTILLALSDCDNWNAFQQDLGIGSRIIYGVSNENIRSQINRRVDSIFRYFQNQDRYKLLKDTIQWTEENEGELVLTFQYQNLETDEVSYFTKSIQLI